MRTSKITPAIRRRILKMAHEGTAQKTIAEVLRVEGVPTTQQTVSAILRAEDPDGLATGRRIKLDSRSRARSARPAAKRPAPPRDDPEDEPGDDDVEVGAGEGLDVVLRRLARRERQLAELADTAYAEKNVAAFTKLVESQARLGERVARLIPPAPPDPALDPAHVEAREKLREDFTAHLAALDARRTGAA